MKTELTRNYVERRTTAAGHYVLPSRAVAAVQQLDESGSTIWSVPVSDRKFGLKLVSELNGVIRKVKNPKSCRGQVIGGYTLAEDE
jgi:hypothetical protein